MVVAILDAILNYTPYATDRPTDCPPNFLYLSGSVGPTTRIRSQNEGIAHRTPFSPRTKRFALADAVAVVHIDTLVSSVHECFLAYRHSV